MSNSWSVVLEFCQRLTYKHTEALCREHPDAFKTSIVPFKKVKVGNEQEMAQSETNSHSKNGGGFQVCQGFHLILTRLTS